MDILYGVVGEGMGHATRSRVVLEALAQREHRIKVVVSGRAHRWLTERLASFSNINVEEIEGLTLSYFGNSVDRSASLFENLRKAPKSVAKNVEVYRRVVESGFQPQVVISDFESWAALYGLNHRLPVISIDNMQVINRCQHDKLLRKDKSFDFRLAKLAVKVKVPRAYHYLVASFFFPPVRKKYTTLVPPILRPEALAAKRERGDHVLVYQTQKDNHELIPALRQLGYRFRVYGFGREGREGNVTLCPFSEQGFLDDLRTARAAVAGGGFSMMSEAVSIGVPLLSVPVQGQFEQELNARYLTALGYGTWSETLDVGRIADFLERSADFERNLASFGQRGNATLLRCLDELLERIQRGEPRAARLESDAPGKWEPETDEDDEDEELPEAEPTV
ncbi:MAG TPA: MJ1255/VC2487 family glycosyltransferase [Polyangiaceae bacterium]|nr:MJ1255/VC2487 family glycosyltransferase [Polyangiaceae bacterium]